RMFNDLQECIWCYGSPTGIPQRWSYDPRKSLRPVQSARLFHGKAFAFQEVYLLHLLDHWCAVEVGSVLRGQCGKNFSALRGVKGRRRVADKDSRPESKRVVDEIPVAGIEEVILSPVRQGRAQGVTTRLRENVGLEGISDFHRFLTRSIIGK